MTLEQAVKLLEREYERGQKIVFVRNPLAWALYRVWKKADGQPDWDSDSVRTAKWKEWWPCSALIMTGEEKLYQCTFCTAKYSDVENFRYCPNCGAYMEGVTDCGWPS